MLCIEKSTLPRYSQSIPVKPDAQLQVNVLGGVGIQVPPLEQGFEVQACLVIMADSFLKI